MTVAILMATYNGAEYLRDQIESIIRQSFTDWRLFIRDDGSTDGSKALIEEIKKTEDRIIIVEDNTNRGKGQLANFSTLLDSVDDGFQAYMFADQDDIWYKDKIKVSLDELSRNLVNNVGPVLVYTNYDVNDSRSQYLLHPAYSVDPNVNLSRRILVQNWMMGCTMMFNKSLYHLVTNIPKVTENHDNWVAKVASVTGEVRYVSKQTMWHRIHSSNVTTNTSSKSFSGHLLNLGLTWRDAKKHFMNQKRTLLALQQLTSSSGLASSPNLEELIKIYNSTTPLRLSEFCLKKYSAFNWKQNILQYIILMRG
ncbi:glycosyltransferase [Lacticaseibacillus baoqingensis]|uniref:Glycosyltransferase n=1 Tax=Lacticaseibacillus baoqingensis TaxID=2486013 RepID=A0ABW4E6K2_9LACO|nr:glycosyltransferase [Lacticaseibacillus baoqingensis]